MAQKRGSDADQATVEGTLFERVTDNHCTISMPESTFIDQ